MFMFVDIAYITPQEKSIRLASEKGTLVSEKNRLGTGVSAIRPRIEAHIVWFEQELADLDRELR